MSILKHQHTYQNTQITLKEIDILLRDDPTKALNRLLEILRYAISCESVCLLFWDENKQRLITTYDANLPENMEPEEYEYNKGLTGKHIFADMKWFRGLINCETREILDQTDGHPVEDDGTINWTNILAFKRKSQFQDFKSIMGLPFVATRQWRGVLKFINKIDPDGNLNCRGFTYADEVEMEKQIFLLMNYLLKLEHIIALQKNKVQIDNILHLQKLATTRIQESQLLEIVAQLCTETLNYKICSVRLFKNGKFQPSISNHPLYLSNEAENMLFTAPEIDDVEYLFSDDPFEANFRLPIVWSKEKDSFPKQFTNIDKNEKCILKSFPASIKNFVWVNDLQSYISIPIYHQGDFFGIIECGTKLPQEITKQDIDSTLSFANSLAFALVNTNRSENMEKMASLASRLAVEEDIEEIYEIILSHIVGDLGFDYAVISRVNHENQTVGVTSVKTAFQNLIDPKQWKDLANYNFEDKDILVDLVKNPKIEIISGPEVAIKWDDRLNREIFEKYDHEHLVRVFVPIIFQDLAFEDKSLVVSIIEAGYHTNHQASIPQHQIELVKLFGNFAESIYKAFSLSDSKAVDRMLQIINSPEFSIDPVSDPKSIYGNLMKVVCEYVNTDAVSVWEKVQAKDSFELKLASVSERLKDSYERDGIETLPIDCYTFDAVKNTDGQIVLVEEKDIRSKKFAYSEIPLKMGFNGMICVPMKIGTQIYSAIVIFVKNKSLSKGEKEALGILAHRAAIAVQSAKIIKSFEVSSELFPDEDIDTTLGKIAETSLDVLRASSIVLFRYQNGKFLNSLVAKGNIYNRWDKNFPVSFKENDLPSVIIRKGSYFFGSERAYLNYVNENDVERMNQRFDEDFWRRERLRASAALRLELKGKFSDNNSFKDEQNKNYVGVMFINYRTEQKFDLSHIRLMETFASFAATAIYSTYLRDQNIKFWDARRRDSFALSISEIASGLAHNSGNLLTSIILRFAQFNNYLEKNKDKNLIPKAEIIERLTSKIEEPLRDLNEDFDRLKEYRKFDQFNTEPQRMIPLINSSIKLLQNKFEKHKIKVDTKSLREDAEILCDSNQIQHLFLNLFINAIDAIGQKGNISLGTEITHNRDFIIVRVSDDGRGIPAELHNRIFEPFFTTKANRGGTGLGLPISKYIAEMHDGHIEFRKNVLGKGTSFFIHLPINKEQKK